MVQQRFVLWYSIIRLAAKEGRDCMAWSRTARFGSTLLVSIHQESPNGNHKILLVGKDL